MTICREPIEEPHCKQACPAGIDIPRYIRLISDGRFDQALAVIKEKIPFPSVCGRACFHPCEQKCQLNKIGRPMAINALKRFVSEHPDVAGKEELPMKSSGKSVAIVGSGPAGLTAAYYLAKLGHRVTVFEAQAKLGGALRYGIPRYELPEDVLEREIENILALGVEVKPNCRVDKVGNLIGEGFDAVFLAPGLNQGIKLPLPGADLGEIYTGIEFLEKINAGKEVSLGKRVAVLGGGGVALDAARSARRLGATEVSIVCLEPRSAMPALPEVIEEAEKEGVIFRCSRSVTKIEGTGHVSGVECRKLRSMEFDTEGIPHIEEIPGSEHFLEADTVISAVGQGLDKRLISGSAGIKLDKRGTILVDSETMATGLNAVFAGGDAVNGPASIIEAIATGRKAAISIDKFLGGDGSIDQPLAHPEKAVPPIEYQGFPVGARVEMPTLPVEERLRGFDEVALGLSEEAAVQEAKRCLRCDLPIIIDPAKCVGCLTCVLRCSLRFAQEFNPSQAAMQVYSFFDRDNEIHFDDKCDLCGLCARYCPYSALTRQVSEETLSQSVQPKN